MSDLIERQDVINKFVGLNMQVYEGDRCVGIRTWLTKEEIIYAINEIPSVEPEWKWIPVTERLPKKENKSYWICTDTKHQYQCRWTNNIYGIGKSNNWSWSIFDIPQYTRVLAWMPLPEPWKGNDGLA